MSLASDTKLHPATLGDQDLAPLAVEPSNGQVPYGKAFVDVLLVPGWSFEVISMFVPVVQSSVQVTEGLLLNCGKTFF